MEAQNLLIDDYEHLSDDVEYILENILQDDDESEEFQSLKDLYNSGILNSCECENFCDKCPHGGNYIYEDGKLILNDDRRCRDLIYECSDSCRCTNCHNKLVQFGPCPDLEIKSFGSKGLGLIGTKPIPKGTFICEYAGEILTSSEAVRRDHQNQLENKMNYIFCLNEINSADGAVSQTFIDPSMKGNLGRYINHSCDANCDIISTRVDCIIPKIAIFSNRDIPPSTEITFNYGSNEQKASDELKKLCFCNSFNCKKFLPNFSF